MRGFAQVFLMVAVAGAVTGTGIGTGVGRIAAESPAHPPATLRVGLWTLWHDRQVSISRSQESDARVRLCPDCAAKPLKEPLQLRAVGDRVSIADKSEAESVFMEGSVTLAAHGDKLTLHNPVRITARRGELVMAVTLPVETYVERVVASESGAADSVESMKALAIVVRSFALHQAHGHTDYDLCDSTHCQLLHWGGGSGRQNEAHAATLATAGETLWFHGQRAQAWFHQNCGGKTASPEEIWPARAAGSKTMPWLASRADPWCTAGGAREWSADLSLADLTAALAGAGLVRPGWKALTVARRGESGRAVMLAVGTNQISAEDFRLAVGRALGWNRILSTWFEVAPQGEHFLFHGRGSGHGVGLCQAGAAAMGAAGRDATQILAQYFPGATASDEATGQAWQVFNAKGFVLETLDAADAAYLPQLTQALDEAASRSGIESGIQPGRAITVRTFRSTGAFRDATLAPGWVAAFTEGDWIATQPLATLASRRLMVPTVRHEFLHALVEGQAAHRAAGWYAQRLLDRYGRGQVLQWLHTGLPASAVAGLK
jgi:stage II sporulation protein D